MKAPVGEKAGFALLTVFLAGLAGLTGAPAHAFGGAAPMPELRTVSNVNVARYLGRWYEIARYENSFQKNCFGTTAEYSPREDGDIRVINRCHKGSLSGELNEAEGRAWVVDPVSRAKLKVRFFWPFSGDYWIIDLGKDYEYAVVGEPDRKYLWILSRTPRLDAETYNGILQRLGDQGYDASKLLMTEQGP